MKRFDNVRAIAFDADDTLWDCQSHFDRVEHRYCELLSAYGNSDAISAALFETESGNMADLGYGCKAFTISLVENAIKVSRGRVSGATIAEIISLGKSLLRLDATPLDGVAETLERLHDADRYRLAVFTKGELLDQENKLHRSGLWRWFDHVSIVSNKNEQAYLSLCRALAVSAGELVMVGNSFKSDIAPALAVGCKAVHVPFHTMWKHEHMEAFTHDNLRTINNLRELTDLLPTD